MKEHFEDILKKRFESFEAKPPETVWQRIEKDFPMNSSTPSKSSGMNQLWYWIIATVAIVSVITFSPKKTSQNTKNQTATATSPSVSQSSNHAEIHHPSANNTSQPTFSEKTTDASSTPFERGGIRTIDTTICGHYFTASVSTHLAGAKWYSLSSHVRIDHPENTETTVYFPSAGTYILIYGNESSTGDSINIVVKAVPEHILSDTSLCGNTLSLPSSSSFTVIANGNIKGQLLTTKEYGNTVLQETQTIDECSFVDTVTISFFEPVDLEKINLKTTDALCNKKGRIEINLQPEYTITLDGKAMTSSSVEVNEGQHFLVAKTKDNCSAQQTIDIKEKTVKPDFTISNPTAVAEKQVRFTNQTKAINLTASSLTYLWDFGDGHTSTLKNPQHSYQKEGSYTVTLTVTQKSMHCSQSTQQKIVVKPMPSEVKVPNIFTPNNDGQNDIFFVNVGSLKSFKCEIFASTTGKKVAEFTNASKGWNGKIDKTNSDAPEGMYYYVISGTQKDGKPYVKKGSVRLSRH